MELYVKLCLMIEDTHQEFKFSDKTLYQHTNYLPWYELIINTIQPIIIGFTETD